MKRKWIKTAFKGVRYWEHPERMFKRKPDQCFEIRYEKEKRTVGEGLGWRSEGMSKEEAARLRNLVTQNIRQGKSPQSIAEMRAMDAEAKAQASAQKKAEERAAVTFGEMADLFLDWSDENKKSSAEDRARYAKHLKRQFSKKRIKEISALDLERLKSNLKKKGLAPATIRQCLQLMKVIFNKTRAWGKHDCLFPVVKFPRADNRRVAFLTPGQAELLLTKIKKKSLRLWCQCVLSLYAGLRFGEVASLELSDIDLEAGTIHVRDGKGGTRHAYLTDPIQNALEEIWAAYGKKPGLIFPMRSGKRKGGVQACVSKVYFRTVEELGLNEGVEDVRQKVVFHTLRHSFASWLVMGGESLVTVQELMGHADISTTMRYSHLAPDIKRGAADRLVKALTPKRKAEVIEIKRGES